MKKPTDRDAALEIARRRAEAVLGNAGQAGLWLAYPCDFLGGATPVSVLDEPDGLARIEAALARVAEERRRG